MSRLYFDHNADAPVLDQAWQAYQAGAALVGNPSSTHHFGREASEALAHAEHSLKESIGAEGYTLCWTSGGTEADAMVLAGSGLEAQLVGAAEHAAVLENAPKADAIAMNSEGLYVLESISPVNQERLVCISLANSETGVIQPVAEVVRQLRANGPVWVHCDGVQAAGRIALNITELDVDSFALAAHKFGGVPGVGALLLKPGRRLSPTLLGGGQQSGQRPGTLQVAGPMSLIAALKAWTPEQRETLRSLRDKLEADALEVPGIEVVGGNSLRLPNTTSLRVSGCSGDALLMALDVEKISISTGSACSSGAIEPSKTLLAMGMTEEEAGQVIRVSLGFDQTYAEVEAFITAFKDVVGRARSFG